MKKVVLVVVGRWVAKQLKLRLNKEGKSENRAVAKSSVRISGRKRQLSSSDRTKCC